MDSGYTTKEEITFEKVTTFLWNFIHSKSRFFSRKLFCQLVLRKFQCWNKKHWTGKQACIDILDIHSCIRIKHLRGLWNLVLLFLLKNNGDKFTKFIWSSRKTLQYLLLVNRMYSWHISCLADEIKLMFITHTNKTFMTAGVDQRH